MEDLFQASRSRTAQDASPEDFEYWQWAGRVIREVSEDVARENRATLDFVQVWVRWKDLASFITWNELLMHKRGNIDSKELRWHETLVSMLVSLGNLIRVWSSSLEAETLELIGFDSKALDTTISSLRESWEEWHGETSGKRVELIRGLLAPHDSEV